MHNLTSLLDRYSKVKIRKVETLFDIDPDFSLIKRGLCGICGRPLRVRREGRIAYCGRKRCPARPKFVITMRKLMELK